MKQGDLVRATCDGRTVEATVRMASPNGRALAIEWTDEVLLGGYYRMMPILQEENGTYRSLNEGKLITLEAI